MTADPADQPGADLVVAGAGIVGLSVAYEGLQRGLSVHVVERDDRPVGASVRNFGHVCVTAQTGLARGYAEQARERWLQLRDEAGLWVRESGTVVVARSAEELAVVREFTETDGELLDASDVLGLVPVAGAEVVGGAHLPLDLRVDPRTAVPVLAAHLADRGVRFSFGTNVVGAEPGLLRTSRGDIPAGAVVLCLGHDLDRLLPAPWESAGVQRCTLQMLRIAPPAGFVLSPAVLTGTSLLRYSGFVACPSSAGLRSLLAAERPELLAAGVNLMVTQHPSGDLLVGDTHVYDGTPSPFASEELDALLLGEVRRLFGIHDLLVRERWLGTYASVADRDYLTVTPAPGVRAVAVTAGIGMTTALGLAPALLDDLLSPLPAPI